MTTSIVSQQQHEIARPPTVLVPLIKEDLEHAREAGMPYYRAAGEKMLEAKPQMRHGEFGPWLSRNFALSYTQARRYMLLVKADEKMRARKFSSINEALKESGHTTYHTPNKPRPRAWDEGVKESIERAKREAERVREAELTRQQEHLADKQLALRLIEIGYKVLAKELHPDRGGSRDAMSRLNRVRDRLKQCI